MNAVAFLGAIALVLLINGCSPTAQRFDQRPDICRDLGKRGSEC